MAVKDLIPQFVCLYFILISLTYIAIFHEGTSENLKVAFRLYRGPLLIIEFLFLIGVNVYGWRSSGVNHVLIFELDPRNHLSEQHLMEMAAIFGVIWTLSLLSFLYSPSLSIPPYLNPLALSLLMIIFVLNPFKVFRHEARFWFLKICGRMFAAPFFHVGFADFWLADQLNSLANALVDFHFLICFYITNGNWLEANNTSQCMEHSFITRPIVNCIPAWIRFAQCLRRYRDTKEAFPHLVNAGKYSTTFFVVIFGTLRSVYQANYASSADNPFLFLFIAACIVNSCYAYTWDIKMDWGLFDKAAGENKLLREEIVYSSTVAIMIGIEKTAVLILAILVIPDHFFCGVGLPILCKREIEQQNFFYYFAIIEDFVLRFVWALSLYLTEMQYVSSDLMTSVLSPLEVFRRFVWNFFRLENEHLNNCGKFRAVRDISVAPLDSSDQIQIIRMMDEDDGVINRGKRKQFKKKEDKKILIFEDSLMTLQSPKSSDSPISLIHV